MNPILQKLLTAAASLITPQAAPPATPATPVPVPVQIQVGTLPQDCKLLLTTLVAGQNTEMQAEPAMNVIGVQLLTGDTLGLHVICQSGARASKTVQATAPTSIAFGGEALNTWDVYVGQVPGLTITTR